MTPEEFQARFMPYAQQVSQRTGLDPRLVLAQSALETGYGRSAPGNNFFGIKSHGQSGGNTLMTQEFENGQMVSIPQSFRGYESPEQSFQGYADFILNNPRYRPVLSAGDLGAQIEAMGASGYATDPEYANKLASIARRFGGDTPRAVASDTRSALGFGQPQATQVSTRGTVPMTPQMPQREQPQGLLQMLGIQPRGEGPQGDRPFYQRDQFRDTAGRVAMAANTLRANPDQNIPAMVQGNRQRREANRTAEWLGQQEGGAEFAQMIASGANPAEVLMAYRQSRMPVAPEQTSGMQNYQFLLSQGVDPQTAIERAFGGGGVSVDVSTGGPLDQWGDPPKDRVWLRDESGQVITEPDPSGRGVTPVSVPIVGSDPDIEAALTAAAEEEQGAAADTASTVILNAFARANEADSQRVLRGTFGRLAAVLPETANAEVVRQVSVLQDLAAAESLNAMRRQSPTGGALGNVTVRELALLSRQAGALDPASPNFQRDLRDYTVALMRTVHGGAEGERIANELFAAGGVSSAPPPAGGETTRLRFNPETGEFE